MALHDLPAVLLPGGALRLLVELAISRDEDIPALVYEARLVINNDLFSSVDVVQRRDRQLRLHCLIRHILDYCGWIVPVAKYGYAFTMNGVPVSVNKPTMVVIVGRSMVAKEKAE
ncbi:unnamed protein product [Fraxinus pennsylvanica]|uniref:Uncharacterized protein n=1 Tax=Fraxinus pennsylvanica TaxID=56036 RepID=A0AAD2EDF1_9LAMI|nr:unnamed protein product [Fraxinus pennsylvanica]